jgi:hypothetical protein
MRRSLLAPALLCVACSSSGRSLREELYDVLEARVFVWNGLLTRQDETLMLSEIQKNVRLVEPHLDLLMKDAGSATGRERILACFALGFAADTRALQVLRSSFSDPAPHIRANAIASSGMLAYRRVIGPDAIPVEEYRRALGSGSWEQVGAALFAIGLIAGENKDWGLSAEVVGLFEHPRPEVRAEAAKIAGLVRPAAAWEPLRKLVKDPVDLVRLNALVALARVGKERAIPELVQAMADSSAEVVHVAADQVHRLAPQGLEYGCPEHEPGRPAAGPCPRCGKPMIPRPKR